MDIALLRRPIEQRITAATGLHANLGRLDVSAFGASLEIGDITLTAPDAPADRAAVVSIRRAKVELSLRKAFRGELRIRSIAVERPIVSILRDASGRLALPSRPGRATRPAEPASAPPSADTSPKRGGLIVVIDRAVVVDGEVHVRDESAVGAAGTYHLAATGLTAELARAEDRYDLTLLGDRIGRVDAVDSDARERANLGRLRVNARLDGTRDLAQLEHASMHAEAMLGEEASPIIRASAESDRILEKALRFTVDAAAEVAMLALLSPRPLPAPLGAATGRVTVRARGRAAAPRSLQLQELTLTAHELTV